MPLDQVPEGRHKCRTPIVPSLTGLSVRLFLSDHGLSPVAIFFRRHAAVTPLTSRNRPDISNGVFRIHLEANMFKKSMLALICVLGLVSMAAAQDAKTVIGNASKASGYDGLRSIQYSGPSGREGTAMGQAQSAAK